ncbi:putative carboxylesterase 2 [Platanthera guangdongensis]|uniref:Carboxylesterase 2 n=1 Tax=Platanthera guangdongensis TaxID=2320717 RepID=A0ABR2MRG1_9ASPA
MSSSTATHHGDEIIYELPDTIQIYRSGRVERLVQDDIVPPSLDPDTGVQSKDVVINPSTNLSARLYLPPSAAAGTSKKLPLLHPEGVFLPLPQFPQRAHRQGRCPHRVRRLPSRTGKPSPAAYDDSWQALNWVISHAGAEPWLSDFGNLGKIFLAGDSAGGNIVNYLGLKLGSEGLKVEGLVPVHSYIWGKDRIGSEGAEWKKSKRSVKDAEGLWPIVCPGTVGLDDPWINPLADGAPNLAALGCRRVLVCVGELDLLRERGRAYYEKLKECGWEGEAEFLESGEEDHVFFLFKPQSSKTAEFIQRLANFFNKA